MTKNYQSFLQKDSIGGAQLIGFEGEVLHLNEPDLVALDISDCPNLKEIYLHEFSQKEPGFLTLKQVPKLQSIRSLGRFNHPVHLYDSRPYAPNAFEFDGKISSVSLGWGKLQFDKEALNKEGYLQGLCLVSPEQPPRDLSDRFIFLAAWAGSKQPSQQLSQSQTKLELLGRNQWALFDVSGIEKITVQGALELHIENMLQVQHIDIEAVNVGRTGNAGSADNTERAGIKTPEENTEQLVLHANWVPKLALITGSGQVANVQSEQSVPALELTGSWERLSFNMPKLEKLVAREIKSLVSVHSYKLEKADISIFTKVESYGTLPKAFRIQGQVNMHAAHLNAELERIRAGDEDALETLLETAPYLYLSRFLPAVFKAFMELIELNVCPKKLWKARNYLLANSRKNKLLPMQKNNPRQQPVHNERTQLSNWRYPADQYQEVILMDFQVWDYCQQSVESAREYQGFQLEDENHILKQLRVTFKHFTNPDLSETLRMKMLSLMRFPLSGRKIHDEVRVFFNDKTRARHLAKVFENAETNELRVMVGDVMCHLFEHENFEEVLVPLIPLFPSYFRFKLLEMSHAPKAWIQNFCPKYTLNDYQLARDWGEKRIERARSRFLMLAMSPETNSAGHADAERTASFH